MKTFVTPFLFLLSSFLVSCDKQDAPTMSSERKRPTTNLPTSGVWTEVVSNNVDMHINADTTNCGMLILHWDAQPMCNKYYIYDLMAPVTCWPANTNTNVWYNQYGWGCGFNVSSSVDVRVQGEYADSTNLVLYKYISTIQTIQTGRGQWNCN